ncbi:MAG: radical SAM protein [Gemmatimonadetes bacterium]|nr:radical SAM protein [Gemmatimonadota bacterium]
MNVLLISCYELGHQPFGVASAGAHLLAEGRHRVECLDLAVEVLDEAKVRRADFVGISTPMHTALRLGVKAGELVRRLNPRCHICYFGLYASLNEDYLLDGVADSVIGGEFETPLTQHVDRLAENQLPRPGGVSLAAQRGPPNLSRQQFLPPARHLLPPLEKYARLRTSEGELRLVGYVEASRGCAHRCRHCPIPAVYEGRLRIVQQDVVLADIDDLVRRGAQHIDFGDPDFLNAVKHSLGIVREMRKRHPELSFDFTAKIEHLIEHRDAVRELAALGCIFVLSAVESVDDRILGYLDKGHTRSDVVAALSITRATNVALRPSLLPFTPWTTLSGYLELLEFVQDHDLIDQVDPVHYSIRLLLPRGSWLLDIPEIQPHLGSLVQEDFVYSWQHPDPRVDMLQRQVARVAEEATSSSEDPATTFYRIKELTLATLSDQPAVARPRYRRRRVRPPQLTEAWFC